MNRQEYNKLHPEISKNWGIWSEEIGIIYLGEEGFIDRVMVKINEEPDNPYYLLDLFSHYITAGKIKDIWKKGDGKSSFKMALEVINSVIEKFPELKDYAECERDRELYVSGNVVENREEFREFFNSADELGEIHDQLLGIEDRLGHTSLELFNKLNELINLNPGNLFYLGRLWYFYIRRFELDKAKEVALKMVAADKYYESYIYMLMVE